MQHPEVEKIELQPVQRNVFEVKPVVYVFDSTYLEPEAESLLTILP